MYWIIDGIQFILSIGGCIYALAENNYKVGISSGIFFLVYPLLNQLIYSSCAYFFGSYYHTQFVYTPSYNISFCGLEKLHPFDSQKYGNVLSKLIQDKTIEEGDYIQPTKIPRSLLIQKMSWYYLLRLGYSLMICKYIEMPLFFIPSFLLRYRVLDPMLKATEGTLIACEIAKQRKWAVNLAGGYHHASGKTGGGFCVYPDITLAVHYVRTRIGVQRVMIIDLDAHQGNGHQRDHLADVSTFIIDCYNHHIYPNDRAAKQAISLDIRVTQFTSDQDYLLSLMPITQAIQQFRPQFIIYNAGTDTLQGDPLGGLNLSQQCLIQRDQLIFQLAITNNIPIVMVLSGGYQKSNANVIANSLTNLVRKFAND